MPSWTLRVLFDSWKAGLADPSRAIPPRLGCRLSLHEKCRRRASKTAFPREWRAELRRPTRLAIAASARIPGTGAVPVPMLKAGPPRPGRSFPIRTSRDTDPTAHSGGRRRAGTGRAFCESNPMADSVAPASSPHERGTLTLSRAPFGPEIDPLPRVNRDARSGRSRGARSAKRTQLALRSNLRIGPRTSRSRRSAPSAAGSKHAPRCRGQPRPGASGPGVAFPGL